MYAFFEISDTRKSVNHDLDTQLFPISQVVSPILWAETFDKIEILGLGLSRLDLSIEYNLLSAACPVIRDDCFLTPVESG